LDGRRIVLVPRAVGAGDVEDYVYGFLVSVFYVARLAEGVEDLGGDVGEDAGALGGDAIADEKKQEPGQELVDVIGGAEFSELVEKIGGKVVRIFLALVETGVTEAETGTGVQDAELAGTARAGALLATDSALRFAAFAIALGKLGKGQVLRRERVRCCFLHERTSKKGWRGVYPSRCERKSS
jgi:hypothetical protein